ncbi:13340_t:CDS:2, partial [Racocetra fulgida]
AKKGHIEIVKTLIKHGANVNASVDPFCNTILKLATWNQYIEVVKTLIEHGANIYDYSILFWAAINGRTEIVKTLIKREINVNVIITNQGDTTLHMAAYYGQIEVVKTLIEHRANVNAVDSFGNSILYLATIKRHIEVCKILIKYGANFNATDKNGQAIKSLLKKHKDKVNIADTNGKTALHWAAEYGHTTVVEILIKYKAEINCIDANGKTALHAAAENGHTTVIEILIKYKTEANFADKNSKTALLLAAAKVNAVDINGKTALYLATENGHLNVVKALINKTDVNITDKNNLTVLHIAAKMGYEEIVKILVETAQINATDNNYCTPLFYAAEEGYEKIINILMNREANINYANKDGITALHKATEKGHIMAIKTLLKYVSVNVNIADINGETALHKAAYSNGKTALYLATKNRHIETVKHLLNAEAGGKQDLNYIYFAIEKIYVNAVKLLLEEEAHSNQILHYIAKKGDIKIINFLLENGENSNSVDENSKTLLHWSAFEGHKEIVNYLLERNINLVKAVDNNNETVLYEAAWNEHTEIVKFLINQGADINSKNKNGWKPLHIAAISCQVEVFKLLSNEEIEYFKNIDFLNQIDSFELDNYSRFKLTYGTTLGLANKLRNLENQFYKLENNIDFLPFYQFFLKCIERYTENLEENENFGQNKKVLNYFYKCTLNKICYLKFESESSLIIDINKYFNIIDNDIKLLQNTNKQDAINKFNYQYEETTNKKIVEAYNIVSNQIKPEMNNIVNKINEKIELLVDETSKLIENIEKNKQNLEKKQKEWKNKLILNDKRRGANTAEIFITENNNNQSRFEISLDIKNSLDRMEKMLRDEVSKKGEVINMAEQQLQKLFEECSKCPDKLSDIKENIKEIIKVLGNINSVKRVKELKSELEQKQKKSEDELKKNENFITSKKTKEVLDMVQNLNNGIKTAEMMIELYYNYQQDKEKLDAISDTIKQTEDEIKKLKQYEENINNTITSMIKRIQDNINNIENKIDTNLPIAIEIKDEKLKQAIEEIEQMIRTNIILEHFKRVINAFKQWVFPFAHIYSDVLTLQFDDKDIDGIIQLIENLKSKMQGHYAFINENDKFLIIGIFNSEYESSRPFYLWKNKKHNQEISKLLAGEEITIKADITKSDPDKRELMLSPYTTWRIKLKPTKGADFSKLKIYKDKVDLELIGHGKYIDEEDKISLYIMVHSDKDRAIQKLIFI